MFTELFLNARYHANTKNLPKVTQPVSPRVRILT